MNDQKKDARIEEVRKNAQAKASSFAELFGSSIGKVVLGEIKEQFDVRVLCVEDAHETIIRAAQRDVVHWIEEVIERGSRL